MRHLIHIDHATEIYCNQDFSGVVSTGFFRLKQKRGHRSATAAYIVIGKPVKVVYNGIFRQGDIY